MTKRWRMGLVLGLTVALHGCESSPTEAGADGSVDAQMSGLTNTNFEGTGEFYAPVNVPSFRLVSRGTGSSENQTLQISRHAERPAVGKYPLGLRSDLQAFFSRTQGQTVESFATSSGELEITVSRPDRIEGRFKISGFRFCVREQNGSRTGVACPVPTAEDSSAPRLEVSGSFVAVPGS